jgi:hypothetical protein
MNAHRAGIAAAVAVLVLALTSCARTSIEEMGRQAIRVKAADAMETFTSIAAAAGAADRNELTRRLTANLSSTYSTAWTDAGALVNDVYLRDHLTTSGGFFGEQRTVSACVRYTFDHGQATMRSINCPSTGPQSEHTDERVTVP